MGRLVCHIVTNWRVARLDWPQIAQKRSTFLAFLSNPIMVTPLELLKNPLPVSVKKIPTTPYDPPAQGPAALHPALWP